MTYKRKEIIGNCTLYLGDNKEVMQDIDLSVVGACVTDPPYGIGIAKNPVRQKHIIKDWDNQRPNLDFILNLNIPTIIWGGNYFNLPPSRSFFIWDKKQPYNFSLAMCEYAWFSIDGNAKIYRFSVTNYHKEHPTQKPIQLMKWCIEQLPKDCTGAILDPFMGSGTTGVACAKMGRSFIGIELDEDYFNIACRRVEDAYKQGDLFI